MPGLRPLHSIVGNTIGITTPFSARYHMVCLLSRNGQLMVKQLTIKIGALNLPAALHDPEQPFREYRDVEKSFLRNDDGEAFVGHEFGSKCEAVPRRARI